MFEKFEQVRVIGIILSDGRVQKVRRIRNEKRKLYDILPITLGRISQDITKEIEKALEEDNAKRFGNSVD